MFKNYLKTALRQLLKNNLFSFINILGLAVGTASFIFICQYVVFELSYDTFHENKDHIYRVVFHNYTNGKLESKGSFSVSGLGTAMLETFPEEVILARVTPISETIVGYHRKNVDAVKFTEGRIMYADPSFLQIFSFPLLKGDLNSVLSAPRTMLISETSARKYFEDMDPVGKLLTVGEGEPFLVQGVFKDVPKNSHLKFDFLLSYKTMGKDKNDDWNWMDTITYLLLPPSISPSDLESLFANIVSQYHRSDSKDNYHLQQLGDIYLNETLSSANTETGSARTVYIMIAIGVVLMLIVLVNFVNLSVIKNLERIKEIALRKMMGASRMQLTKQFLTEAMVLNGLAFLLAIGLIGIATPIFEPFGWKWSQVSNWHQMGVWIAAGCLLLVNIFITGIFPALSLSFFQAIQSIKANVKPPAKGISLTGILIIFQFMASLTLLTSIFVIHEQLRFMKNQGLAIDISHTLVIKKPHLTDHTTAAKFHTFKRELEQYISIKNVTHSTSVPGQVINWNRTDVRLQNPDNTRLYPSNIVAVGYDFIKAYKLRIIAGRDFRETMVTDSKSMLINEEAAKHFEFVSPEDAMGKRVFIGSREFHIIGVVNNYHHRSLKEKIAPTLYFVGSTRRPVYSIKVSDNNLPATLAIIEEQWERIYSDNVFSYFFLDEFYERQYQADRQFGVVIGLFAALVLLIAGLGLFGLAYYTTVRRTKEIGIRKVLGASVVSLLTLLSRQYLRLIAIALFIAIPIANYFIVEWLGNFAYQVSVRWWMFAGPGIVILLIALLSVAGQTWKTANTDPVQSLRHE